MIFHIYPNVNLRLLYHLQLSILVHRRLMLNQYHYIHCQTSFSIPFPPPSLDIMKNHLNDIYLIFLLLAILLYHYLFLYKTKLKDQILLIFGKQYYMKKKKIYQYTLLVQNYCLKCLFYIKLKIFICSFYVFMHERLKFMYFSFAKFTTSRRSTYTQL